MTGAMLELTQMLRGPLVLAFAVFLRIGAAMALMPGFGDQTVPMRVKLVLALAFTAIVWPMAAGALPDVPLVLKPQYFLTEAVIGLALGIFFRLFVMILQLAGMMAAQATSLSQIFGGGATPDPMPAFGNLLVIGGLALAMTSGLHVKLALALAQSYTVLPFGLFPSPSEFTEWGVSGIGRAFGMAFSLAAPFVIASVIYNVAIGAINKAMPQLMVAFIGAPAITFGGLLLLATTAPLLLYLWLERFNAGLANPFGGNW
ncbi:MAG: flagellar biosynthetic protein FliR [Rhodobacteraceae bacterium]|nr:flagellar biosynthetic protein FliR [Paracoccaceae bacterium]